MRSKKKPVRTMKMELDGQISLVEFQGNKRIATHPIDGKLVLRLVIAALSEGLTMMDKKR